MPHLVIVHTPNIKTDFPKLCQTLVDTILGVRDEQGAQVFPEGGTRVMSFPASGFAVGDGKRDHAFVYLNLRIVAGRSEAVIKRTGDAIVEAAKRHLEPVFASSGIGMTLNIDTTPAQLPGPVELVYQGFHNNLRAIYGR